MPNSSKRGELLQQSPIRNLVPYSRAAEQKGTHIFHLNIGQPDIPTPEYALEQIKKDKSKIIKYGPSEGLPTLRDKVAEYYGGFEAQLDREDVFITTGASEAILFALLATCDEGDEILVPEPFYANYLGFSSLASVKIKAISTYLETEFALPSNEDFESKISDKTKAILLCNPGNPTGQLYSKEDLEALLKLVHKKGLFLIVDEVYREFCYDSKFTSALAFPEAAENVIIIDSISKVFSACGARIGYLISKNKHIQDTVIKYAQLRLCPPYLGQKIAEASYHVCRPYIQKAKEEYQRRREVLYEGLSQIENLNFYKPKAAFYNIVELPLKNSHEFCKWLLKDFVYEGSTVMLAPANGFYFNTELGASQVRIAYVLNANDLKKSLTCLSLGLEKYLDLYPAERKEQISSLTV